MRIAQIMAGAPHGGAELFFERMTIALHNAGETILPIIRADAPRAARLREAGLAPIALRFGGKLDVFTKPKLRRVLQNFKADIAIAWMSRAAAHLPTGNWTNTGRLGGYYNLKYYRACAHLIGNTNGIVTWIAGQNWPREKLHYLPNFVDDFADTQPIPRAALGVPEGAKLILALGRLHPVKGFDTLLHAMALLPEAHLIIAGEGKERAALQTLITQLGLGHRARLLGWRNDSGALLKTADLFISSSRHEPLGNMVLEAFSAASPVLAAKAEGPTEIIRDGQDGILVPINDPAALAAAADSIFASTALQQSLATAGRRRFEAEFSETIVTEAWLQCCRALVGGAKK